VLELVPGDLGAGVIEDHEPGAGGALVHRPDEIGHFASPLLGVIPTSADKPLFTGVS
jgi:hypothetical protein